MRPYAETAPQSSWNAEPVGMINDPLGKAVDVFADAGAAIAINAPATTAKCLPRIPRIGAPRRLVDDYSVHLHLAGIRHEHRATGARPVRSEIDIEHERRVR